VDYSADFVQCIIDRTINEWQNDCDAVSMTKDSIRTRVATFDTAKYLYYSDRNTVCLKDLPFLFIMQHKLWNDAQLRIAMVARFNW